MGNSLPKMSVRTRIALVPVVAAALCLLAVSANQDMDERAVIADLVKEAAGAYTTAASAAVTALAEAEKNQPSKEDKIQECICAARGTAGTHVSRHPWTMLQRRRCARSSPTLAT